MFISSCPLRVSLFGGSTDNLTFIEKFNYGAVISFSCSLRTYITSHQDKLGYNLQAGKYIINYSKREEVNNISEIKNDPIRVVLDHFNCAPMTISLNSDAYSQGSGLASSSSYIISLIKNISLMRSINMFEIDICKLAHELELKFNPYCGYQDPYGCCIGGFKKIEFEKDREVKYNFLDTKIFNYFDMHLVFTGVMRNSSEILEDVTKNIEKSYPLLDMLDKAYQHLKKENFDDFIYLISESWQQKKKTSKSITSNNKIQEIDKNLYENKTVLAHKLCGAGNGGFFLVFSRRDSLKLNYSSVKIQVEANGVEGRIL